MKSKILPAVTIIFCFLSGMVWGQSRPDWMGFTLMGSEGDSVSLQAVQKNRATVFIFLDPDCPVSQKYGTTIRTLYEKLGEHKIALIAVYPVVGLAPEKVRAFAKDYQYPFLHLLDTKMQLVRALNASVTPEAFLVDPYGRVIYHGAIDNWFYELGRYRRVITKHYLQNAIVAYLTGKEHKVKETKAIGCFIGTGKIEGVHQQHHKP